jgi:hypothetical protein
VNEQSNLERLVRDPSTGEMAWLKPSIDTLDLATLPDRLDDETLARVENIARSPLPALPACDGRHLAQALRMMLAVLPRRQADDLSGELFVAAYERQLGGFPNEAISYLCDQAIKVCKWFPTVSECLETLADWRRNDDAVHRQRQAEIRAQRERNLRMNAEMESRRLPPPPPLSQADVDAMPEKLVKIGLSCGALVHDNDGNVRPAT